jgi:hypothetical protein
MWSTCHDNFTCLTDRLYRSATMYIVDRNSVDKAVDFYLSCSGVKRGTLIGCKREGVGCNCGHAKGIVSDLQL